MKKLHKQKAFAFIYKEKNELGGAIFKTKKSADYYLKELFEKSTAKDRKKVMSMFKLIPIEITY